ncbi:unnamed protein product [Periconia digitata]|uniref:Alpha-type protein kinase domain-containing protein n=1 Tax=Periconia digitata TaxID=1303443 RepID=A0A9W4XY74_9PLEO|nr:unnamed protein product [Periconia digitata]
MQPYLDAAKEQVKTIIEAIERRFLNDVQVRVAVVSYKDHGASPHIEFLDFTTSMSEVRSFLGKLRVGNGDDYAEDVLGGLHQATKASRRHQSRCIFHIADAPGHGHVLHDLGEASDSYYTPGEEPHGLLYAPIIQKLVSLGIDYTFFHITSHTDRMLLAFSCIYDSAGADSTLLPTNKYHAQAITLGTSSASRASHMDSPRLLFQELHLGTDTASLMPLVLKSVTASVCRTSTRLTLSRSSARRSSPLKSGSEEFDTEPPQWHSSGYFDRKAALEGFCPEVVVYSNSTLMDMMHSYEHIKLSFIQHTVRSRSTPFAKGASRLAHHAQVEASGGRFVVKSFAAGGHDKCREHQIEEMRAQALCKAFALEFNGLVRQDQWIDFIVTACLQPTADAAAGREDGCLSLERRLEGQFAKYNNNTTYVNEELLDSDPVCKVAQAFSHFTFERSWGDMIVVDLQGVGNILTDPVIHTKDPERFKLNEMNMSTEGFKFFFAAHDCNDVCHQLELVSNREMALSGNWRFRERWPALDPTLCCSNKLCQSIIRLADAYSSPEFSGYYWCNECWPEIESSTVQCICIAPGDTHEFPVSRFFYASQGKVPPQKCPEHNEKDKTALDAASVGGGIWSHMKNESRRSLVLGSAH